MATYYVDLVSGNDANDGTAALPWKTQNKFVTTAASGDTCRLAKTGAHTTVTPGANFTFTKGSTSIVVGANVTANFAAGDYIGKTTATGNGSFETFYRISAIVYSAPNTTITLHRPYYGTTSSTEASALKLTYTTDTGQTAGQARTCTINAGVTFTFSGGWDISDPNAPVQNGETWFKGLQAARTTAHAVYYVLGTAIISKVNIVETYSVFNTFLTLATTMSYCSFHTYINPSGNTSVFTTTAPSNLVVMSEFSTNGWYSTVNNDPAFDTCLFNTPTQCIRCPTAGQTLTLTNCVVFCSSYGVILQGGNTSVINVNTSYLLNTIGVSIQESNCSVSGGTFESNTYAIDIEATTPTGAYIKNLISSNNGVMVRSSATHSFGVIIDGCSSTNDGYGWYNGTIYSRDIRIHNCDFTTPATNAVRTFSPQNTTFVTNCTIDGPSTAKLVNDSEAAYYPATPRFQLTNCTGWVDGQYFPKCTIVPSAVTYRVTPPSLQFTFKATTTVQKLPIKIWGTYGKASTDYDVSVYIKAGGGWSGTIVPLICHNGGVIHTGTTISSLTTGWVKYTYSIDGSLITSDGELSVAIIPNANTVAIYFDDFEALEV